MTSDPRTFSAVENLDSLKTQFGSNLEILLEERYAFFNRFVQPGTRVLELGAGIGITANYLPACTFYQSDVEQNPWLDAVIDGEFLPFPDRSFDAIICMLALHHMPHPGAALKECSRVLSPGGHLVVLEARNSWLLRFFLRLTGHEYVDPRVDPFGSESCQRSTDNWNGNNAIGDLLFEDPMRLKQNLPDLTLVHHRYTECALFLNSGGVNKKVPYIPLPKGILRIVIAADKILCRLAPNFFPLHQEVVLRKIG